MNGYDIMSIIISFVALFISIFLPLFFHFNSIRIQKKRDFEKRGSEFKERILDFKSNFLRSLSEIKDADKYAGVEMPLNENRNWLNNMVEINENWRKIHRLYFYEVMDYSFANNLTLICSNCKLKIDVYKLKVKYCDYQNDVEIEVSKIKNLLLNTDKSYRGEMFIENNTYDWFQKLIVKDVFSKIVLLNNYANEKNNFEFGFCELCIKDLIEK